MRSEDVARILAYIVETGGEFGVCDATGIPERDFARWKRRPDSREQIKRAKGEWRRRTWALNPELVDKAIERVHEAIEGTAETKTKETFRFVTDAEGTPVIGADGQPLTITTGREITTTAGWQRWAVEMVLGVQDGRAGGEQASNVNITINGLDDVI